MCGVHVSVLARGVCKLRLVRLHDLFDTLGSSSLQRVCTPWHVSEAQADRHGIHDGVRMLHHATVLRQLALPYLSAPLAHLSPQNDGPAWVHVGAVCVNRCARAWVAPCVMCQQISHHCNMIIVAVVLGLLKQASVRWHVNSFLWTPRESLLVDRPRS